MTQLRKKNINIKQKSTIVRSNEEIMTDAHLMLLVLKWLTLKMRPEKCFFLQRMIL